MTVETTTPARVTQPAAPTSVAETGLGPDRLVQLLVKALHFGEAGGGVLAERLRLPYSVIDELLDHIRAEQLVEIKGVSGAGKGAYRYAITDLGRTRAREFLEINRYVGAAPVPLAQYVRYMRRAAAARAPLERARITEGFSHLVVSRGVIDQLGPAVNSGKSIFLYGPPGNGKTVLAEAVGRAIGGEIYIPHALDVDGQIIKLFDPVNHDPISTDDNGDEVSLLAGSAGDRRWVRCRRPVVTVGGELTLDMLDLTLDPVSKFYEAPFQLKANGGVFVVDDFGRQRVRPRDLLNRWIVPLENRVDYLTLHTGKKFELPFDVLIIFATNLRPETLADEAFLRRIPYKIMAKGPTVEEFTKIFEQYCRKRDLAFDPVIVQYLLRKYYAPRGIEMRACHPRDLIEHVIDRARYAGTPPAITRELLDAACESYFLEPDAGMDAGVELGHR